MSLFLLGTLAGLALATAIYFGTERCFERRS
jgi:hypothetical protein